MLRPDSFNQWMAGQGVPYKIMQGNLNKWKYLTLSISGNI